MKKILCFLAIALTFGLLSPAMAQFPEKPVQFVVPWPPGDLEDVLTRLIAEELQDQTGVPAAVVNVPGGGGVVGATQVFQAPADGHTVGSFVIGIPTVQVQNGNTPYDRDEFEPLGIFVTYPFVIAAAKDAPYDNLLELAEYSQENDVSLGHFGFGLVPTRLSILAMEDAGGKFASEAAFDMLDCATLASGDVGVINTTVQLVLSCLDDVKILASLTDERISVAPDAMTLSEQIDGYNNLTLWNGLFVRKDTPQEARDVITKAAIAALESDAAQDIATSTGASVYWRDADNSEILVALNWYQMEEVIERMGR